VTLAVGGEASTEAEPPKPPRRAGRALVFCGILVVAAASFVAPVAGVVALGAMILFAARGAAGNAAKPLGAFAITAMLIPSRFTFGPYATTLALLIGFGLAILWIYGKVIPTSGFARGRERVVISVAAFFGTVVLSYGASHLTALTTAQAKAADRGLAAVLALVAVALLIADGIRTRERLHWLIGTLVFATAGMSIIGIIQFVTNFDVAQYIEPPGASQLGGAITFIYHREGLARVAGTTRHPIEFAVVCAAVFPLAAHLASYASTHARRWFSGLAAVLLVFALPMALSRSGILAFTAAVIVLLPTWKPSRRFRAVLALAGVVALLLVVHPDVFSANGDLLSGNAGQGSNAARTNAVDQSFIVAQDKPLLGEGFSTHDNTDFLIDNQYLLVLVEMGAVGLIGFVAMLLVSAGTCRLIRARAPNASDRDLAQSLFAGILAIGVGAFGLDVLVFPTAAAVLFMLIGCVAALDRMCPKAPKLPIPRTIGLGPSARATLHGLLTAPPGTNRAVNPADPLVSSTVGASMTGFPSAAVTDVVVALVTYNSENVLRDCLASLPAAMEGLSYEVIVADNASSDSTTTSAREAGAHVIDLGGNRGYSAGVNAVVAQSESQAVLVLNPDVRLHPGSVRPMFAALSGIDVGAAAPRIVTPDGALDPSLRRESTVLRAFGEAVLGGDRAGRFDALGEVVTKPDVYDHAAFPDWASGAVLLVSRRCLHEVGPWDESFFLYSEEKEFLLRARDLGYVLRYVPDATATHLRGDGATSTELRPLMMRNKVSLYRLRRGWLRSIPFRLGLLLNEVIRSPRRPAHRAAAKALATSKPLEVEQNKPPDYLCFAGLDWWAHGRAHNDFQLMVEVAKTRRVLVVNSIGMRVPLPGRSTMPMRRIFRKARSVGKLIRQPLPDRPEFHVMTPISIPVSASKAGRELNARFVRLQVNSAMRYLGLRKPVVFVTVPTAWEVVRAMPRRCTIYNRSDIHSAFKEADQKRIRALENTLLRKADYVTYSTRGLMEDEADRAGPRGVFSDHGVDLEHFRRRSPAEVPAELRDIPGPRIGYIGVLRNYTVDLELLEQLAVAIPTAQLVLVGSSHCAIDRLEALPNVHWLGFRPYSEIPRYGSGLDVAIMPWLRNEWMQYASPIKLKEYLALGLPVVTTPFGDVERFDGVIRIARDGKTFIDEVRRTLDDGGPGDPDSRRAFVSTSSWSNRARDLIRLGEEGVRPD
jgi:GT2 family glycosyltransferase/O-antigen ligase